MMGSRSGAEVGRAALNGATGLLLVLGCVLLRDVLDLSLPSFLALLGALSLLFLAVKGLELAASRVAPGWLPAAAWKYATIAVIAVPPLVLGLVRWRLASDMLPGWTWPALAGAAAVAAVGPIATWRVGVARTDAAGPGRLLAALLLTGLFLHVADAMELLQAVRPGTGLLHAGLYVGLWIASSALVLPLGARSSLYRAGREALLSPWLVALLAALGLALVEADRRVLPGLYPPAHLWLGVTGILCLDTALHSLVAARRGRAFTAIGSAAALALVASAAALPCAGWARAPALRAEMIETATGSWVLEALPDPARPGRSSRTPIHPALRFERYLDEVPDARDLNLLLITVDALRADCLGKAWSTKRGGLMPRLEELAGQSVRFRRAYAQGTRTVMAMGALMLGRYSANLTWELWPYRSGRLFDPRKTSPAVLERLRGRTIYTTLPRIPRRGTLARRIRAAGLHTMAALYVGSAEFFQSKTGLGQGFRQYRDLSRSRLPAPHADHVAKRAIEQIDRAQGKRWFEWVHIYDPHESRGHRDRYKKLLAVTDKALGRMVDELRTLGQLDRTVIVVTADHGESFGEHKGANHGTTLYEEQAHIPLLIRMPGVAPRSEDRPVAAIDVTATLLVLAGASTEGIDGVNLVPLLTRGAYPEGRPVFLEIHRYNSKGGKRSSDAKGVVLDNWKLIVNRKRGAAQLFDLGRDPGERRNLVAAEPEVYERLEGILTSFVDDAERRHPLP
jgi:choline-sulfatase